MLEIISLGYALNIVAWIAHFFVVLFSYYRGDKAVIMAKMDYLKTVIAVRRMKSEYKIQYSVLIPFGFFYWFFAFHFSYLKFKGDTFDKLINYYTYN